MKGIFDVSKIYVIQTNSSPFSNKVLSSTPLKPLKTLACYSLPFIHLIP